MIRCSRVAVLSCFLALLAAGCGPHASPEPSTGGALAMPAGGNGAVVFDPQSPMLERITRVPVRVMDLPTDEVIAAGKIEANPMHLSKLVMPVTGRIGKVLVALGESVRAGQPLFTVQSPDADAATQAYVSAQAALTQAVSAQTKAQANREPITRCPWNEVGVIEAARSLAFVRRAMAVRAEFRDVRELPIGKVSSAGRRSLASPWTKPKRGSRRTSSRLSRLPA